ncbi:MAG: hypothetical protein WA981_14505 [Glaciecola sp.]
MDIKTSKTKWFVAFIAGLLLTTVSLSSNGSQDESAYFRCAGKLLNMVSDIRILANAVDDIDYLQSKLAQCDSVFSDCDKLASEIESDVLRLNLEITQTKQRFLSATNFCLNVNNP